MNTVIMVSFDNKFELDKLKILENDYSNGYNVIVKRLVDLYKKTKELN